MQTLRTACSKVEPKIFAPPQTPFTEAQENQNLISWRWSLPSPTYPVWWRLMHAFQVIVVTDPQCPPHTNAQTHRQDQLQCIVPQLSVQCNNLLTRSKTSQNC